MLGDGNDFSTGGAGNDILLGGDGNDTIAGNGSTDVIAGNQGSNSLNTDPGEVNEQYVLSAALTAALNAI